MLDPQQLLSLLAEHKYIAIAALVIGLVVRLLKEDVRFFPTVPAKYRATAALFLGYAAGALDAIATGKPVKIAVAEGVVAASLAMLGHFFGIEFLRKGREIGAPKDPPAPPTGGSGTFESGAMGVAKVAATTVFVLALVGTLISCTKEQAKVISAGVATGCELVAAVTGDGRVTSICATQDELETIVSVVADLLKSHADAGPYAFAGKCQPVTSKTDYVCAPPALVAAAIDRAVLKRSERLYRDAAVQ